MKIRNFIAIAVAVIMLPIMMFAADKDQMVPILNKSNQLVGWKLFEKGPNGKTTYTFFSPDGKRVLRRVTGTQMKVGGKIVYIKMVTEEIKEGKLEVVRIVKIPFEQDKFRIAEEKGAKLDAMAVAKYNVLVKSGKLDPANFDTPETSTQGEPTVISTGTETDVDVLKRVEVMLNTDNTQPRLPESELYSVK